MGRKVTNLETAIRKVFTQLESKGFVTGTPDTLGWNCCQTCSWSSFDKQDKDKSVVFYDIQDREHYREDIADQKLEPSLYLAHSILNKKHRLLLLETLIANRINIDWDMTTKERLRVFMAPKENDRGQVIERSEVWFFQLLMSGLKKSTKRKNDKKEKVKPNSFESSSLKASGFWLFLAFNGYIYI